MLLTAYNYKMLSASVILVLAGFAGMYLEGQQYGIYSLYIAPLMIITGFVVAAVSVFRTDPSLTGEQPETPESSKAPPETKAL